jgi:hypothetical protein
LPIEVPYELRKVCPGVRAVTRNESRPNLPSKLRILINAVPSPPDLFLPVAIEHASLPEVADLLRKLAARSVTLSEMNEQFSTQIIRRREAETGKRFKLTKAQARTLAHYTEDSAKIRAEQGRNMQHLDDAHLLVVARGNEEAQLSMDEAMLKSWHPDNLELAKAIIEFRWETLRIIEAFIEASPLKETVRAMDWLWKPRIVAKPPE